jgi:membrane protease YdiL (CAAX protease family)
MKSFKAANLIRLNIFIYSILSLALYLGTSLYLQHELEFGLIILLFIPCLFYSWVYRNDVFEGTELQKRTTIVLIIYATLYFISIFFVHLLGSSVSYWFVQFLIPILVLKVLKERLASLAFQWSHMFKDFWVVLVASAIVLPILLFNVRDSSQILAIAKTWKILVYFPLSLIYMFLVVGFWEEFFFRGVILRSLLRLTNNSSFAIFASALLFSSYHIPMRYFNSKSPYFDDLLGSISATINEQFIMGLFLGFIVHKSKNVWHGVWLHSMLNGLSFVYQLSLRVKV